jgi:hypothetical protein
MSKIIFLVFFLFTLSKYCSAQDYPDSVYTKCLFNYLKIREDIHKKLNIDTIRFYRGYKQSYHLPDTTVYGVKILTFDEDELYRKTKKKKVHCVRNFIRSGKDSVQYIKIEHACYRRKNRKKNYRGEIQGYALYRIFFDDKANTYGIKLVWVYD